jgi:hypothetical protein
MAISTMKRDLSDEFEDPMICFTPCAHVLIGLDHYKLDLDGTYVDENVEDISHGVSHNGLGFPLL